MCACACVCLCVRVCMHGVHGDQTDKQHCLTATRNCRGGQDLSVGEQRVDTVRAWLIPGRFSVNLSADSSCHPWADIAPTPYRLVYQVPKDRLTLQLDTAFTDNSPLQNDNVLLIDLMVVLVLWVYEVMLRQCVALEWFSNQTRPS